MRWIVAHCPADEPPDGGRAAPSALQRLSRRELGDADAWGRLLGHAAQATPPLLAVLDGCLRFDEAERLQAAEVLRLEYFAERADA